MFPLQVERGNEADFIMGQDLCAGSWGEPAVFFIDIGRRRNMNYMKKTLKRVICSAMALLLILGMMPSYAMAEEAEENRIAVEDGTGQEEEDASALVNSTESENLNDFVTGVNINAEKNDNGSYIVYPNTDYGIELAFSERQMAQIDFSGAKYQLPEGFEIGTFSQVITINVYVIDNGNQVNCEVKFMLTNEGNHTVVISPSPGQDDVLEMLGRASNAQFSLNMNLKWVGESGEREIDFGSENTIDITVPSETDLDYGKTAVYNKEKGTVDYTVTVTSTGNSKNVVIKDVLQGTAVAFDTDTIRVTGSLRDEAAEKVKFNELNESGFTTEPVDMTNGESITITYSAPVDYDKLTGNDITFDNVKNTVTAKADGDENPDPVDVQFSTVRAFDYALKSYDGNETVLTDASLSGDGEYYILPWEIEVNPELRATGDITFTDKLQNSGLQKYDPASFEVTVYDADGKNITDEVWEKVSQSASWKTPDAADDSWTQTLPGQIDGKTVRYVIKYNTQVAVDDLPVYGTSTVGNELTTGGDDSYSPGNITLPGQADYQVEKTVPDYDKAGKSADWKVEVTVPEQGFNEKFVVTDTLPSGWFDINGDGANELCKHTLPHSGNDIQTGTITVRLGNDELVQGTDYVVSYNESSWDADTFTLTFMLNRDENGNPEPGLPAAAGEQTVTIEYTSSCENWPSGQAVTNRVSVEVDGENEKEDTATYTPVDKSVEKTASGNFNASSLDQRVFYTVTLAGVTQDDLDEDGYVTVTDTFDARYLELALNQWDSKHVSGTNSPGSWGSDYEPEEKDDYTYTAETDSNTNICTVTFKFKPRVLASNESGNLYYARYFFSYSLKIKDEAALKELVELAAKEDTASLTTDLLKNTAKWNEAETELTVTFDCNPLDKTLSVHPAAGNGYAATWSITINPLAAKLNNGNDMEIVDDFRADEDEYEMTYVQNSMVVKYDGVEQASPEFTYDDAGILTWKIPDSTKVEIEYQTQITGSVEGKSVIRNEVSITGKTAGDSVDENFSISSSGGGTATATGFTIYKVDANDVTNPLKGATFRLWATENGQKVPLKYTSGNKKGQDVVEDATFTTGEDGIIHVVSDEAGNGWSLWRHRAYILEETEAPDGYEDVNENPIEITIWLDNYGGEIEEGEVPCPDNAVVIQPNTTIRVTNGQVRIPVSKTLTGREWTDTDGFQIQITPEGNSPAVVSDEITLTKEVQSGEFLLSGFGTPGTYIYTVNEAVGSDETISYSQAEYKITVTVEQIRDESGTVRLHVSSEFRQTKDDAGNTVDWGVEELVFTNAAGDTTSINVEKKWDSALAVGIIRPASVQVQLLANDVAIGEAAVLSAANGWKYNWSNLAKNDSEGTPIKYTVKEVGETDGKITFNGMTYQVEYTGNESEGYAITNSHTPEKVSATVTKVWNDAENRDGKRPESIEVDLVNGNTKVTTVILSEANKWTASVDNLDRYTNGKENTYAWEESEKGLPAGYTLTGNTTEGRVTTLTNSYTPETVDISGSKTWNDEGYESERPESITINLYADGGEKPVASKIVTAADGWKWSFTGLPKYCAGSVGEKIVYTISEDAVSGYVAVVDGYDITNTYQQPDKTSVSVRKIWNDAENQDGKRPESIQVQLYADGEEFGEAVPLSSANGWKYIWTNLEKNDSEGTPIEYTVEEVGEDKGTVTFDGTEYTVIYGEDTENENWHTITNSHTPEKVSATVTKVWNDAENRDGKRPESIEVHLMNGNTKVTTVTLSEANKWTASVDNLDRYTNGKENTYAWEESEKGLPAGYTLTGNTTEGRVTTLTNSYTPETVDISGSKTWNDEGYESERPESITINLYADGGEKPVASKIVTAADGWKWSFTGLPKYCAGSVGEKIVYTISEDAVSGYVAVVDGYDITNTYQQPDKTSVSVRKIWNDAENQDGKRPESIEVQLYADGEESGEAVALSSANGWKYTWTNLEKNDSEGNPIEYTVKEVGEDKGTVTFDGTEYTVTYGEDTENENGYTVTNSYTPETVDISGSKTWNDEGNESERPKSITIRLYADNEKIESREVTAEDDWSWNFTGLPKYREGAAGEEIVYTISEDAVSGYESEVTGYDVTNTYRKPGITSVSVAKVWKDSGDKDGMRPESILVQLYADGKAAGKAIELNEENSWRYLWNGLDEYSGGNTDGKKIVYTVKEVGEDGGKVVFDKAEYSVVYKGDASSGYTITNSLDAETTVKQGGDVQTGDHTPVTAAIVMMAAALGTAGVTLGLRRSRQGRH